MNRKWILVAILVFLIIPVVLTGCSSKVSIKRILAEPSRWENEDVRLTDIVGDTFSIPGSDKISYWLGVNPAIQVVPARPLPVKGTKESLIGIVRLNYKVGTVTFPIVIIETHNL
jgi:hypothetical protein